MSRWTTFDCYLNECSWRKWYTLRSIVLYNICISKFLHDCSLYLRQGCQSLTHGAQVGHMTGSNEYIILHNKELECDLDAPRYGSVHSDFSRQSLNCSFHHLTTRTNRACQSKDGLLQVSLEFPYVSLSLVVFYIIKVDQRRRSTSWTKWSHYALAISCGSCVPNQIILWLHITNREMKFYIDNLPVSMLNLAYPS